MERLRFYFNREKYIRYEHKINLKNGLLKETREINKEEAKFGSFFTNRYANGFKNNTRILNFVKFGRK